jgi:hypothetical protein
MDPIPSAPSPDVDPELARKRERERTKKANWRLRKAGKASERQSFTEKRGPAPAPFTISRQVGPLIGPMGTGEARRTLYRATVGVSRVIGSQADWHEDEFDEAGDAFADIANHFWPLRLFLRILAPLILFGALVIIGRKMLSETPWWQARQARRRIRELELQAEAEGTTAEAKFTAARDAARRPAPLAPDRALGTHPNAGGQRKPGDMGTFSRRR